MSQQIKEVSSNFKTLPFIFKERIDDMVPEYPSNSNKSKQDQRQKREPVVTDPAEVRKKKENKYFRMIFQQDYKDVKQSLFTEYVEPKVKELAWNFIQAQIDYIANMFRMMIYKDYKPVDRGKLPAERYSYNNIYQNQNKPAPSMTTELNYDEFTYTTYGQAAAVLGELKNLLATGGKYATVLDLYELSKIPTTNYTLNDWGWTDLSFAEIKQDETGRFFITLPKAKALPKG